MDPYCTHTNPEDRKVDERGYNVTTLRQRKLYSQLSIRKYTRNLDSELYVGFQEKIYEREKGI